MVYPSRDWQRNWSDTLLGTNISPCKGTFKNDFPFPQAGYVSSLEGNYISDNLQNSPMTDVAADDDEFQTSNIMTSGGEKFAWRALGWGTRGSRPLNRLDVFCFSKIQQKRSVQWCMLVLYFFWDFFWESIFGIAEISRISFWILFYDMIWNQEKDLQEASWVKISLVPAQEYTIFTRHFAKKMKKICQHFSLDSLKTQFWQVQWDARCGPLHTSLKVWMFRHSLGVKMVQSTEVSECLNLIRPPETAQCGWFRRVSWKGMQKAMQLHCPQSGPIILWSLKFAKLKAVMKGQRKRQYFQKKLGSYNWI